LLIVLQYTNYNIIIFYATFTGPCSAVMGVVTWTPPPISQVATMSGASGSARRRALPNTSAPTLRSPYQSVWVTRRHAEQVVVILNCTCFGRWCDNTEQPQQQALFIVFWVRKIDKSLLLYNNVLCIIWLGWHVLQVIIVTFYILFTKRVVTFLSQVYG